MNKQEFLAQLHKGLSGLPQEDIEERLTFYSEMIDDRIEEGLSESEAVSEIGSVTTTTGNIKVNSVTVKNDIDVETDTGEITLTDASCADLIAESDTGTITLKNVVATGNFSVESETGDVRFKNSDAAQISVKTSTGDVSGTLLSEKVFITETSTGRISVPKTTSGGECEITTSTGDIEIDVTS